MILKSVMATVLLASCASPEHLPTQPERSSLSRPPITVVGSAERGGAFARARCSSCHAVGSDGDSPIAAAPPLREISRRYPVEQLGEAFAEGFVGAHSTMPEFVLDAEQNRDLLAYLESIQTRR
ncbi:MAG: cytochrome c class [Brevundimonas sp.]|nr:cytochrome c class [Brevundimonas sp.]